MGMEMMIHNGMLEYMPGTPYGVFTYTIAELDHEREPLYHLYAAFIKRDHTSPFSGGSKAHEGEKIIKRYRPSKEAKDEINRLIKGEHYSLEPVTPEELYGKIKDHMPIEFDERDVVLQIARYDAVYCRKFSLLLAGTPDAEIKRLASKMHDFNETESLKSKERDRHRNNYISLQKLIDNWLGGKMYVKDIKRFMEPSDFKLVNADKELSAIRHIDMSSHGCTVSVHDDVKREDKDIHSYRECCVKNTYIGAGDETKDLKCYADDRGYLAKWIVRKVKGEDTDELEAASHLIITGDEMITIFRDYLRTKGFVLGRADIFISCYDPVNDIECINTEVVDIPFTAIKRFRETGQIFLFDKDMIEKERKVLFKHMLCGRDPIKLAEMDYDPSTFEVVSVSIKYVS